ncbi:phosphate ABC transporter permease PstA [Rhabdothermincola salaria]|uniref:phosphate ABC transporter permease PstA n=1 Tax=Rhabdothermincola salaria TaxID=2903142 RepID=UPI001E4014E6|nr:phosphate ABC transporter permease PstA [Rhabdothermincola salaria]MCD9625587.1 phosphate ABC transporter permease PstA [Rhabdothermincola salaria]
MAGHEPDATDLLRSTTSTSRRVRDRVATVWMVGSLLVAVVPLALVVGYVTTKGIGLIEPGWFTERISVRSRIAGGGMAPAIVGTLVITGLASLMAVPLGILGAIHLNEYGGTGRTARLIRFVSDVMTGVPSVVMGLFVFTVWTVNFGLSAFGGALALACLMLPIVIRSSEEMLRLVPDELRHASYALGDRKWHTILKVVLPSAAGGLTSGAMLAVARAAGETAPLLFTIGVARVVNPNILDGPTTALSVQIFDNAQNPFLAAQDRAWAAAFTLVVIVFLLTLGARAVSARIGRGRGA